MTTNFIITRCLRELYLMGSTKTEFSNLESRIAEAVTKGAAGWFSKVLEEKGAEVTCDDDCLENLIQICQSLMGDLKIFGTVYQAIFERIWQIPAFNLVYVYYDNHLTDLIKPVVDKVTKSLKSIHTCGVDSIKCLALEASGEVVNRSPKEKEEAEAMGPPLSMGTSLFELYLLLQQFHKLF